MGQDIHYLKSPKRLLPVAKADGLPGLYMMGMLFPPLIVLIYLVGLRITGGSAFKSRMKSRKAYGRALHDLKKLDKVAASFWGRASSPSSMALCIAFS